MKNPLSILGGLALVTVFCVAISTHYQMKGFGFALFLGWFAYGKIILAMSFTQGYGVKGMWTIAGMPMMLAAFIALITSVIVFQLVSVYQPSTWPPETIAKLRNIGWSAAVSVGTAVFHWYAYGRRAYFHESEYNVRVQCRDNGDSPEATAATIARHRASGVVQ